MGLSTILTSSAPSHSALVRLLHVLFCTFNKNNFSGCFTISFLCACLHFLSSHSFLCKNKLYIFNSSTNNKEHTTTKLGLCQREMRFSFVFPPKDRSTVFMTSQRATRQVVRQHYTTRLSATTRKWLQGYFFVRLSELRQLTGLPRYLLLPAAWRLEEFLLMRSRPQDWKGLLCRQQKRERIPTMWVNQRHTLALRKSPTLFPPSPTRGLWDVSVKKTTQQ